MKITAPVSSVQEVEMLLHYGADELYCGVNTQAWSQAVGSKWWMNRRSPNVANLASKAELKELVAIAHRGNVPVHITLNTPFYTGAALDYIVELATDLAVDAGVDSLIVSDMNLLIRMKEINFPVRLHLSSLGSCFNAHAARMYRDLGVHRIILPRQIKLSEIERLVSRTGGDMEFEVFAVNDGCVYEEGFCQTTHTLGPFCMTDWEPTPFSQARDGRLFDRIQERLEELRQYRWYQDNCGSSYQDNGLPNGPCSLCWFGHFKKWGITAVKIVGREASFYRKMRSLQMVKAVMNEVERGAGLEEIRSFARNIRATPDHCHKGFMCYFKDETVLEPA